jgi:hypothetical protein
MATSRKTTTTAKTPKAAKATPAKATPAGPKRRSTAKTEKPAAAPEAAPEARPHLRAVAPVPEAAKAPELPKADAAGDTRFKRTDLIEAVAQRTALKRGDAKVVLDLVLEELGRALDRTDELVLPPLGKLSVKRRKPDAEGPDVLTLKLRRPGPATAKAGESPLADPDEDG